MNALYCQCRVPDMEEVEPGIVRCCICNRQIDPGHFAEDDDSDEYRELEEQRKQEEFLNESYRNTYPQE